MKIITQNVSRKIPATNAAILGEARAKIAAHHFYRLTPPSLVFSRLLTGLAARNLISRRPA